MKRFLALGLGSLAVSATVAGEPVSVHPPGTGSSLNQSLPAVIQSALPNSPAPVMTSAPSWGGSAHPATTVAVTPTSVVNCQPPASPAACGPTCVAAPQTRPHFNLLGTPWGGSAAGCSGGVRERVKEWMHYQPGPGDSPRLTPTPYRPAARAYFPYRPGDCGTERCGTGGGGGGPAARPGFLARVGLSSTPTCAANLPYTPLSTGTDCNAPACRPRVLYVPLSARAETTVACGVTGSRAGRPTLLQRMLGFFSWGGGDPATCPTCGANANCPPPPPSPVHYATPGQVTAGGTRYAQPCTTVAPTGTTTTPITPPAVEAPVAMPAGTNGKQAPVGVKVGAVPVSPTRAFTSP